MKTRLNWLQTVIDGQKSRRTLDEMSMISIGQKSRHNNLVEDSMYWNRATLQTNTERGSVVRDVPFVYTTFLDTLLE